MRPGVRVLSAAEIADLYRGLFCDNLDESKRELERISVEMVRYIDVIKEYDSGSRSELRSIANKLEERVNITSIRLVRSRGSSDLLVDVSLTD